MTEAEKAYQYFVITVPENEEQAKAYFWARKALQPTLTPPNEPLTLEQLRGKVGQPVVIKYSYGGPHTVAIVDVRYVPHLGADKIRLVFADGYITVNEKDYGTYFTAYSYPTSHIDREAWEPCGECAPSCWNCVDSDADEDTYPMTCQCCVNHNQYRPRFKFCSECGRPLTEEAWDELENRLRGWK